jgi:hypothetical protein
MFPVEGGRLEPREKPSAVEHCSRVNDLRGHMIPCIANMQIPEAIALTGADGRSWRPDKAPQDLKDALAARQRQEHDEAAERVRAAGGSRARDFLIRNDPVARAAMETMRRNIVGDGLISPASNVRDEAPAGPDGAVLYSLISENGERRRYSRCGRPGVRLRARAVDADRAPPTRLALSPSQHRASTCRSASSASIASTA